ncbi:hypothetical protein CCACVL1_26369 [Corchorus capsularis]|uniref:Uncharacterized protein n=1 Tax=Corchorus capsularis TaxID=210143 RepID=A0A1R3GF57_COCAP|nr:hypothetical protein CCACVL1_26369 [Corchorus capsularis]
MATGRPLSHSNSNVSFYMDSRRQMVALCWQLSN